MHEPRRIDDMQRNALHGARLGIVDHVMIARVSIDDAAAAGRDALQSVLVKRLQEREDRARPLQVLCLDQLLAGAKLTGGDKVLHAGDHEWNDHPRSRDAGRFGKHARLHDLGLDLPEPSLQYVAAGAFRYQYSGRPHQLVYDIAGADEELLDASVDARADVGPVEVDLPLNRSS